MNNPAVNKSVRDSATSNIMTPLRSPTRPLPGTPLPVSRSDSLRSHREACNAGTSPNRNTVQTPTTSANTSTAPFISMTVSEAIV